MNRLISILLPATSLTPPSSVTCTHIYGADLTQGTKITNPHVISNTGKHSTDSMFSLFIYIIKVALSCKSSNARPILTYLVYLKDSGLDKLLIPLLEIPVKTEGAIFSILLSANDGFWGQDLSRKWWRLGREVVKYRTFPFSPAAGLKNTSIGH